MSDISKSGMAPQNTWDGLPMPKRLWAIFAVSFGVALSVLDGSIANVALPTIAQELNVSSSTSIWIVNAYQLAIMISLLSFSTIGDIIGYRKIYVIGLAVFTIASLGSAMSRSIVQLAAARAVQGFGAAALTSVNTTLIRIIYPNRDLGKGMGINATVVAISAVAGPTIAAGILSVASWRWLFAVNIPVGIIAFVLSSRYLPLNPVKELNLKFDWRDGIMNALTFGLFIASIEAYSHGIGIKYVALGIAAFLIIGFFFIRSQLRKPYPLFPVDLLKIPIFSLSITTSAFSFMAQTLALISLPFMLQREFGFNDVSTGLIMTAWPAVIMVIAPLAGILVGKIHAGLLGGAGLFILAIGLVLIAFLPSHPSYMNIVWRMAVCGLGFGLFQSPNNSVIIASAPENRSGSASGMLATARLVGQTTGAALVAVIFHVADSHSSHIAMLTAAGFALVGAILSVSRKSMALPATLTLSDKKGPAGKKQVS